MKPYYEESGITIYHSDWQSCEALGESRFDLLLTDPPYGILNLKGEGSTPCIRKYPRQVGSGTLKNRILNQSNIEWDIAPTGDELTQMRSWSTSQIIWGGNYFPLPPTRGILVWDKEQPWENFSQVELAWTNLKRPAGIFRASCTTSVPNKEHPTQKPISLMKWCISLVPSAKSAVDPFCGSGTTLLACKDMGLTAIGTELEERYCEIAANRLRQSVLNFEVA